MTGSSPPPTGQPILEPEPGTWEAAVRTHAANHPFEDLRRETRQVMGLATDHPVLATGHQASAWHPGILAKDVALAALRETTEDSRPCSVVHFIADHDANDGGLIHYPVRDGDELRRGAWRALPPSRGRSTRDQPATRPTMPPSDAALPSVTEGLHRLHAALAARAESPCIASQLGGAMAELSEPFVGTIDRFGMSAMLATPIGRHLLDRMQQDPRVCAEAFNAALLDIRQARRARRLVARPLALDPVVELPLWETGPEGRRTVRADEPLNPERLRPKALLATALVRLAGCDGFIHGLGGAVYDEAMERWIERWLGETWATALAPRFTATATLRLPLPVSENPVEFDAVDLRRRMHDPVPATDGRNPSPQKRALLEEIDAAPRNSSQRIDAFNALQAWLEDGRRTQAGELEHLAEQVVDNRRAARSNAIATARDWAFPLHTHQSITEFVANPIRAAFAAQITPSSVK